MTTRESYYLQLPTYTSLKEWQTLIKDGKISEAITFWKAKGLRHGLDCYVQLKSHSWVSPLYYCCLRADAGDMIKLLLRTGADPDQQPDSEVCDYLPFVCHSLYLKTLVAKHKGGPYIRCDMLDRSITHRLNVGNVRRLVHLINLKVLDCEIVRSYIRDNPDIIEDKLQTMIRYLTYYYNVRTQSEELNLTEETNRVTEKFRDTVEFLIRYGAQPTENAITLCLDHYLHEIWSAIVSKDANKKVPPPQYHTQMNSTKVATLRPLLNDDRYVKMCLVTGHQPDPEVYNYDIMA